MAHHGSLGGYAAVYLRDGGDAARAAAILAAAPGVEEVLSRLQLRAQGDPWLREHPPEISIYQEGGAFEMEEDHPFLDTLKDSVAWGTGKAPVVNGSAAGNDARLLRNIGKMPTVILGPGPLENCHMPDEWLPLDEYLQCILTYAHLIVNWTGGKKS